MRRLLHLRIGLCLLVAIPGLAGCGPEATATTFEPPAGGAPADEILEQVQVRSAHDELMDTVMADVTAFWDRTLPEVYGIDAYEPTISGAYTAGDGSITCQGEDGSMPENAFFCPGDDFIAWDGDWLFGFSQDMSAIAPAFILAHEYGHAMQDYLGVPYENTIDSELGADCLAGAWAADLQSRGGLTREDFDQALVTLFEGRDAAGTGWFDEGAHGTGYERNRSFGDGVEGGVTACVTPAG